MSASWFNVLGFLVVWAIIWLPIALLVSRLINWQPKAPLTPKQKLILLATLYILAPGIVIWKVNVELITFADLGLSFSPSNLLYMLLGLGASILSCLLYTSDAADEEL
jgi:hypothetical protein